MKMISECLRGAGCYHSRRNLPPCRIGCSLRSTAASGDLMRNIRVVAERSDKAGRAARDVLESIAGIQRVEAEERLRLAHQLALADGKR